MRNLCAICLLLVLWVGLSRCRPEPTPPPAVPTLAPTIYLSPTSRPTQTAVPPQEPTPTGTPAPGLTPAAGMIHRPVTAAEQESLAQLWHNIPPVRQDIPLLQSYNGLPPAPWPTPPAVLEPLQVGTLDTFFILDINQNSYKEVVGELLAVSEHAYFWFDQTEGNNLPTSAELATAAATFDQIYQQVTHFFGSADEPGVDGDPRIHIFHASPVTICGVSVERVSSCGLLGYFSTHDLAPAALNPRSNEREMMMMNGYTFGRPGYYEVLAHEFRHTVDDHYDRSEQDWFIEGSATLAQDLLGYAADAYGRANWFLNSPEQQLTQWNSADVITSYGQGYLLNRYLFDRLGEENYRQFAQHPADGLRALDAIGQDGVQLWLDWLVALIIHPRPEAPAKYDLPSEISTPYIKVLTQLPQQLLGELPPYAADYYQIKGQEQVTVRFLGSTHIPLLEVAPAGGQMMWVTNRQNYSTGRLTRSIDLRQVSTATLFYEVYHNLEKGYDFAYVSVSTDGGLTWQGLTASHMAGLTPLDDPSNSALTERFYTGRSRGWLREQINLTPYVGQEILLRFELVTDPILSEAGWALDNIQIPEIGFTDDVETVIEGWQAEGFVRATAEIPHQWQVQLITFPAGGVTVQQLVLRPDQWGELEVNLGAGQELIIVISSFAPSTLQSAGYLLALEK